MVEKVVFIGVVGMKDSPRPEVKEAIANAKKAGIRVIMKTGDHKETAIAIAEEIGLISSPTEKVALTQQELEKLSNKKSALKKADIGIAMGQIGTDVARESSDMILTDDNFASIISATEEGRTVFTNVKQTSLFLITTNFAEITTLIISLAFGFYFWGKSILIILPATIIFMNLVTDGFVDIALACEPRHEDVLNKPPRRKEENILSKDVLPFLALMVIIMTVLTIFVFKFFLINDSLEKARAGAFAVMAMTQLFNVLNMRSLSQSIFKIGFFSNKFLVGGLIISILLILGALFIEGIAIKFGFIALSFSEFLIIFLLSSLVLWNGEAYKYFKNKK